MTKTLPSLASRVRLEVATNLPNLVANHSGQTGSAGGWTAPANQWGNSATMASVVNPTKSGATLTGTYTGGRTLRATIAAPSPADPPPDIISPAVPVTPNGYIGITMDLADGRSGSSYVLVTAYYKDGSGQTVGSEYGHPLIDDREGWLVMPVTPTGGPWAMKTYTSWGQVPPQAATAQLHITFWDNRATDQVTRAGAVYLSRVMVVRSVEADAVQGLTFTEGTAWRNVIGDATTVKINRGGQVDGVTDAMDVGTATATVLGASVDPTFNRLIRPGTAARVSAASAGGTWAALFTGKIHEGGVSYAGVKAGRKPTVTLTITDAVAEATNTKHAYNYTGTLGSKVRAIIDNSAATVAYATDAGAASTTRCHIDTNATVWGQLEVARNSVVNGKLWVDRTGVIRAHARTGGTVARRFVGEGPRTLTNWARNPDMVPTGEQYTPRVESNAYRWSSTGTGLVVGFNTASGSPNAEWESSTFPTLIGDRLSVRVTIRALKAVYLTVYAEPGAIFFNRDPIQTEAEMAAGETRTFTITDATVGRVYDLYYGKPATIDNVDWRIAVRSTPIGAVTTGDVYVVEKAAAYNTGRLPLGLDPVPHLAGATGGGAWDGPANNSTTTKLYYPTADHVEYLDIDATFGSRNLTNELIINRNNSAEVDGSKAYGPYRAAASVAEWGRSAATVDIIDGDPDALAVDLIRKYATPRLFPNSVRFRVATELEFAAALGDLYDVVGVALSRIGLDETYYVIGIEHEITARSWHVTLRFRALDTAPTPVTVINASGTGSGPVDQLDPAEKADSGWINVPLKSNVTGSYQVRKINGVVYTKGQVNRSAGSWPVGYESFATLPDGFQPAGLLREATGWYSTTAYNSTMISLPGGSNRDAQGAALGGSGTSLYLAVIPPYIAQGA